MREKNFYDDPFSEIIKDFKKPFSKIKDKWEDEKGIIVSVKDNRIEYIKIDFIERPDFVIFGIGKDTGKEETKKLLNRLYMVYSEIGNTLYFKDFYLEVKLEVKIEYQNNVLIQMIIRRMNPMDTSEMNEEEPELFCRRCGMKLEPGARFCTSCGMIIGTNEFQQNYFEDTRSLLKSAPFKKKRTQEELFESAPPKKNNEISLLKKSVKKTFQKILPKKPKKVMPKESPKLELRKVQFSAIAPTSIKRETYTSIDIIMYENQFRYVVDKEIEKIEVSVQETKSGVIGASRGAVVKICLSSPDIDITENEETQVWQSDYLNFRFVIVVPEQYKKHQILFHATVYINEVIATNLKFIINCAFDKKQEAKVLRNDIFSAFISYASEDRKRVATIIQGLKVARPDLDIFFDVESLRSGENWKETLGREIEKRDILFLCWSHFAKQSEWVEREWRYAFENKGIDSIEPIPIEMPDICPPPKELNKKHFNDKLLYIINQ